MPIIGFYRIRKSAGLYENGNQSDAAYALVQLDSLGEVLSMRLEGDWRCIFHY